MRDYSDAPEWATEAFQTKPYEGCKSWYYGNDVQYISKAHVKSGGPIHKHNAETFAIIGASNWWREPLNIIVENE